MTNDGTSGLRHRFRTLRKPALRQGGEAEAGAGAAACATSFGRALVRNVVGVVAAVVLALLLALVWQGAASNAKAEREEIGDALGRAMERLHLLVQAAEMTTDSLDRAARTPPVTGATLSDALAHALAAFEQRPELSYLGIVLATGEYGTLARADDGAIRLWLFPGAGEDAARVFRLGAQGFVREPVQAVRRHDPRQWPFYQAALALPSGGTWLHAYRWRAREGRGEDALWGVSYVKPLRDKRGQLIGVVDAALDLPALNRFLTMLSAEHGVRFQIVETGGASPRLIGDPVVHREPLPLPADLAGLAARAGQPFVGRMAQAGERSWVAVHRLELAGGLSWTVVASRKARFVDEALAHYLYQVAGMGALLVAVLALTSVRLARRFGRPLEGLALRVATIGQRDRPGAPGASDAPAFREIRVLSDALDRMAAAVLRQREADEQKVASLALKGALFDSTDMAIFSLDAHGDVIEWNAAAERVFGLAREDVLGRPAAQAVRAPDGPADWRAMDDADDTLACRLAGAHEAFDAELRCVRLSQDGQAIRTLIVSDVTERNAEQRRLRAFNAELEQRVAHRTRALQALNRELDSFCHSVSHDLRAPLRSIAGFSGILSRDYAQTLDERARDCLDRIGAATRRMGDLIADLLDLSRMSRQEMKSAHVDLSAMARDILAQLRHDAPSRRVDVRIEDGLGVEGDPRLLRIMLENLLGNAWKFTSKTPSARIVFAADRDDEHARAFLVGDNGAGFDMRYADRLFGAFQRLHTEAEFPGTGIGLATVQRVIHRHGGRIAVQAAPGEGATFRFCFPDRAGS